MTPADKPDLPAPDSTIRWNAHGEIIQGPFYLASTVRKLLADERRKALELARGIVYRAAWQGEALDEINALIDRKGTTT